MGLYALAVARLSGQEHVDTWIYALDEGDATHMAFGPEALRAVAAEVVAADAAIQERLFTPAGPMPAERPPCAWCPFRSRQFCSFYG
jgi:hypothetical protein